LPLSSKLNHYHSRVILQLKFLLDTEVVSKNHKLRLMNIF